MCVAVNGSCTLALTGCYYNRGRICSADTGGSQVEASTRPAAFFAGKDSCTTAIGTTQLCLCPLFVPMSHKTCF